MNDAPAFLPLVEHALAPRSRATIAEKHAVDCPVRREIASVAPFLASDESSAIIGGAILTEGGPRSRSAISGFAPYWTYGEPMWRLAVALVIVLLSGWGAALAAVGDSTVDACLNAGTAEAPCAAASGITHDFPLALSPDGRQLYVATRGGTAPGGSAEDPTIVIFDRDPTTGTIVRRLVNGCVTSTGSSGACVAAPLLTNPQDMVVSQDGKNLYVGDAGSSAIIEFARASDGTLTLLGACQATAGTCGPGGTPTVNGMGIPYGLAVASDALGDNVYVRSDVSEGRGTLLVFDRQPDGTLRQKTAIAGCFSEASLANCADVAGISRQGWQLAVAPDGKNLYATGRNDSYVFNPCFSFGGNCPVVIPPSGTIATFGRTAGGTLTFQGCIASGGLSGGAAPGEFPDSSTCSDGNDALIEARSVTISQDGTSVYVGSDAGIVTYSRDAAGVLTDEGAVAVTGVYRMAVVPDGTDVVAASQTNGYDFLARDTSSGALTKRAGTAGCMTQSGNAGACTMLAALAGIGSVVASTNSMFLYLTDDDPGALVVLHRDFAPVCDPVSESVTENLSAVVSLVCSDPNGDAVGGYAIVAAPTAGTLAAIDENAKTVRYNPFTGFVGTDMFTYTAVANGVAAAPATATLDVAVPPVRLDSQFKPIFKAAKKFTRIAKLEVDDVPAGGTVAIACAGKGCPFETKTLSFAEDTPSTNLARLFKRHRIAAKLRVGTTVEIDVTATNAIGRFVVFEMRARTAPSVTDGCLSPTGTKIAC